MYRPGQTDTAPLDIVTELDKQFFPDASIGPKIKDTFWWLVYDDKNEVVGYAGMRYVAEEKYGYYSRAGILAAHRKQGLHKRLIATRMRLVKQLGGTHIYTYVAKFNHASVNALVGRGFRLYTPNVRWAGPEFLYLQLELSTVENVSKHSKKPKRKQSKTRKRKASG